jgi:hypothetical protein
MLLGGVYLFLSFEFEYRKICTIKRDTNGELGWFQVLIFHLS